MALEHDDIPRETLEAQCGVLTLIATGTPLAETLTALVRNMQAFSKGMLGSVLLLDLDGKHLRHGAAPDLPMEFVQAIDGLAIGPRAGSCGTTAFLAREVITADIATDPLWADYKEFALGHGLRACWSTPILASDGRVLGTFAMYYRERRQPRAADQALMKIAAHLAAVAIAHEQATAAIRSSERMLRTIFEHCPAAVAMFDRDMRYVVVSERWRTDYRLVDERLIGRSHYEVFPEIPERWREIHRRGLAGETQRNELDPFPRQDGTTDWVRWQVQPWHDARDAIAGIVIFSEVVTGIVRAQEALHDRTAQLMERERQLSTLIGNLPGMVYRFRNDAAFTAEFVSSGVEALTGYPAADFIEQRRNFAELIDPRDRAAVAREVQEVQVLDRALDVRYRIANAAGQTRWLWNRGSGVRDEVGHIVAFEGFVTDITERERVEDHLRQQAELLDVAPSAILVRDFERRITYWNAGAERLFGWTMAEALGRDIRTLLFPDATVWDSAQAALWAAGETALIFESTDKAGRALLVEGRGKLLRDLAGEPLAVMAIMTDVTAREADARTLRESLQRTQLLIEASSVGLWDWDLVTNAVYFSPEWKRQLGYADAELPNAFAEWETRVHPDDLPPTLTAVRDFVAGRRQAHEAEFRMRHRDGSWRWIYTRAELMRDAAGQAVRMMGCHVDVTERKHSLSRLQELSRRLLEIQESERRQLARELHDEFGQLLTAIKINIETAAATPDRAVAEKRVAGCVGLVDQAIAQVRSLSLALRPPLLDELGLAAALRWLAAQDQRHPGLSVALRCDDAVSRYAPAVETACFRIAQEAVNNVLRYAAATGAVIDLQRQEHELHLRVRDDGIGFDFTEAHRRSEHGASLGLLGMEERAALAGGRLEVRSAPGAGTEVHAWFPV